MNKTNTTLKEHVLVRYEVHRKCPLCDYPIEMQNIDKKVWVAGCFNPECHVKPLICESTKHRAMLDWEMLADTLVKVRKMYERN
jgi:hypothetical protein